MDTFLVVVFMAEDSCVIPKSWAFMDKEDGEVVCKCRFSFSKAKVMAQEAPALSWPIYTIKKIIGFASKP